MAAAASEQTLAFEGFELDLEREDLRAGGEPVPLHATPLRLLVYLVRHRARVVPKHELLAEVWPDVVVSDTALSSALKELRRALGDDGASQRFVSTQRGRGYRWIAPVEVRSAAARAATALIAELPAPAPRARRLAVLPFKNLSADPADQYFADGVTEDIVAQLAKVRGLSVAPITSSARFAGSGKSLREIAAELAAGYVVEGSVRRAATRVRIVCQLIEAASDEHVWSETYDREAEDIFAIQQDVAERIAAALRAELSDAEHSELTRRPTRQLVAYDLYLLGRQFYRRWQRDDNETAIDFYRRAVALDPDFALAWAGLASALGLRTVNFQQPGADAGEARETALRALSLEPSLAEAHKALGIAHLATGRVRDALSATLRAVELQPGYDEAVFNLAGLYGLLGRWDESLRWWKRLILLRPQPPQHAAAGYAAALLDLGFDAEAKEWTERALAFDPLLPELRERLGEEALMAGDAAEARAQLLVVEAAGRDSASWRDTMGWVELQAGDLEAAAEHFRASAACERAPTCWPQHGLACCEQALGRPREAERLLSELRREVREAIARGNEDAAQWRALAAAAALSGDADEAIACYERAVEAGWRHHRWDLREPAFARLRANPRFAAQLARVAEGVAAMRARAERSGWHRPEAGEPV